MSEAPFKLPLREGAYNTVSASKSEDGSTGLHLFRFEHAGRNQRDYIITAVNEREALRRENERLREAMRRRGLSAAPCDVCGYNGPGYYQHKCDALRTPDAKVE